MKEVRNIHVWSKLILRNILSAQHFNQIKMLTFFEIFENF